jgi:hypothetical protein
VTGGLVLKCSALSLTTHGFASIARSAWQNTQRQFTAVNVEWNDQLPDEMAEDGD